MARMTHDAASILLILAKEGKTRANDFTRKDYDRQVYRLFAELPDLFCPTCQHPIPSHQTEAEHAAICDKE